MYAGPRAGCGGWCERSQLRSSWARLPIACLERVGPRRPRGLRWLVAPQHARQGQTNDAGSFAACFPRIAAKIKATYERERAAETKAARERRAQERAEIWRQA